MNHHRRTILYRAGRYVTQLLIHQLPKDRVFHNLHHTINVTQGALKIGQEEQLTDEELEIVMLAAWFHDTGHIKTYTGHEQVSMQIARDWLEGEKYPAPRIESVLRCIEVTTMPQRPETKMEAVICDADLYHLSFNTYDHYQEMLREEWRRELGIEVSDEDWNKQNAAFLTGHHYFTEYGRENLESRKTV
ncbi:HD domain-containing protein [Neolewinella litorea]|uniref:HD domain-containing protein n=1 Tax=Neolewinella litorea TaxID=2562452 RepID=A0A4S4NIW5_9BACT|nr:HD domain-containing protein [Neolewinella litorea]THH39679.1 HD domain-containing protein [Neolewinella litorea]